ncbi:MAG: NAD(P)/FAD-dependent oxidoreductase [Candidatus Korarchaeota archaeon]|nr:NAD(P)/FAD-dependent oxidoreductase [Candidatus Korarchaeota archaeon]
MVGAGPAGSASAALLARSGLKVLLLEMRRFPRDKPCGGGLTLKTVRLLEEFGFHQSELPIQRLLDRVLVRGWGRSVEVFHNPWVIATVDRADFDASLVHWAEAEGAEFLDGEPAIGVSTGGEGLVVRTRRNAYSADWVIGADGVAGSVGRWVGLRSGYPPGELIAAVESRPSGGYDVALFQMDAVPRGGYGWAFPLSGRVNVGVGGMLPLMENLKGHLERYVRSLGLRLDTPVEYGVIPIGRSRRLASGRVLLVGDAAGLADPLTGEGIYQALVSARAASQAILSGDPGLYERLLGPLLQDLELRAKAANVVLPRMKRFYDYMASDPEIARRYTLANVGELEFREFWRWVWTRVPLAVAKRLASRLGRR